MKNLFNVILVLIPLILFVGCERGTIINVDYPFEGEKLVVYSVIRSDSPSNIEIYLSEPISTTPPSLPNSDTEAFIEDENSNAYTFDYSDGIGYTNIDASIGDTYQLSVDYKDLSIHASVEIPSLINIDSFSYDVNLDDKLIGLNVYFHDHHDEIDYYKICLIKKSNGNEIYGSPYNGYRPCSYMISDEDFTSEIYRITKEIDLLSPVFDNGQIVGVDTIDEIIVKLEHVSPSIPLFNKSLSNNAGSFGNEFSSKDPLITNIINGYGYFGAITVDSVVIEL